MLTFELVRSLFNYKDGFLYDKQNNKVGALNYNKKRKEKRWKVSIKGTSFLNSRVIFIWHHGYLPAEVDHQDRNTLNDKIENLRAADRSKNMKNRTSRKNSTSKYLGVCLERGKYWKAQINSKLLGYFKNEELAALAYNEAAIKHHGEFANLNKIETKKKTMINITIEGESASDVRKQIQELLGLIPATENPIKDEKIAENFAGSETQVSETEKPAEEIPAKKRRSRAEIDAEKNTPPASVEEKVADDIEASIEAEKTSSVTKEMLQNKAVELIRLNKKPEVVALLKKFGADSIAQDNKNPLKVEDYSAVMDELNKL